MNDPGGLVDQLLETVQQRMEGKVLARLRTPEGANRSIPALIDDIAAEESSELAARAKDASANGEDVQAEMYRLMQSELLPHAVKNLRARLHPQ